MLVSSKSIYLKAALALVAVPLDSAKPAGLQVLFPQRREVFWYHIKAHFPLTAFLAANFYHDPTCRKLRPALDCIDCYVHNRRTALEPEGSHDPDTTETVARAAQTKVHVDAGLAANVTDFHTTLNRSFDRIVSFNRWPHFGSITGSPDHNTVGCARNFDRTIDCPRIIDSDHNFDFHYTRAIRCCFDHGIAQLEAILILAIDWPPPSFDQAP
jgi:hypothetical protein